MINNISFAHYDDTAYNTSNRQNHHNPTNQHTQAHMAHKMMTIDGTEYILKPVKKVPTEATPNKSEKKRKPDDDVVEHAPKKVSAYNMYVKEQRADVTARVCYACAGLLGCDGSADCSCF